MGVQRITVPFKREYFDIFHIHGIDFFSLSSGPGDIMEHNLKLILGLIWTLILRYQLGIGAVEHEEAPPEKGDKTEKPKTIKKKKQPSGSAKKLLLGWLRATLPDENIKNITTNWNDGVRLSGLVDNLKPGLIPNHSTLDPNNALQNTRNAMDLAEEHFGIPQVSICLNNFTLDNYCHI